MRTCTAVVRPLGTGETALGPAIRRAIHVEEGVFLFETEPGDLVESLVHNLLRVVTEVGLIRRAVVVVALGQNEDVVTATERIFENRRWPEVDIRVVTWRLVGRRAVEIPDTKTTDVGNLLGDGLERITES
jgi:hypothetical protein